MKYTMARKSVGGVRGRGVFGFMWFLLFGLVYAFPQPQPQPEPAGTIFLPQFGPLPSGVSPSDVTAIQDGTAWAQPIGTASDGSETTAIIEEVQTTVGLVTDGSGQTVVSTAVITAVETVIVSASGWAQSNFPSTTAQTDTHFGGGIHCFYTSPSSGECDEVEVLPGGVTSSRTLTGSAITAAFEISTGTLPGVSTTTGASASVSGGTSASVTQPTTTPSSGAQPAAPAGSSSSSSSNAAAAATKVGFDANLVAVVIMGMLVGGWLVL